MGTTALAEWSHPNLKKDRDGFASDQRVECLKHNLSRNLYDVLLSIMYVISAYRSRSDASSYANTFITVQRHA